MAPFHSLFLAASTAIVSVLAAPTDLAIHSRAITTSETSTNNGFYYSVWTNDGGSLSYTNGAAGEYNVSWSGSSGNVVVGKGWGTGSARAITYTGSFSPSGNAYLSIYGWTTAPLIEYYIVESFGDFDPSSGATLKGSVTSDGGTYDVFEATRTDAPSVEGTATFQQYWSVRRDKRVGGTVTTASHFDAWAGLRMELGTFNYQIIATEGYESSGSSAITVS